MNKPAKKIARHRITFHSGDDNESVALAKMGLSNRAIKERTKLSDGQITYRLHKAKTVEGNDSGYRVAYRNGESDFALRVIHDLAGVLREEVRRTITPKIEHPTPKIVE
jgi:hypothetical protein